MTRPGCKSPDRNVGPWTLVADNAWQVPVWVRQGPLGYRSLYSSMVAFISTVGAAAHGPDGMTEESLCFSDFLTPEQMEGQKRYVDRSLREMGWIVDGIGTGPTLRQRIRTWWKGIMK